MFFRRRWDLQILSYDLCFMPVQEACSYLPGWLEIVVLNNVNNEHPKADPIPSVFLPLQESYDIPHFHNIYYRKLSFTWQGWLEMVVPDNENN
jgi:hypothetical protein